MHSCVSILIEFVNKPNAQLTELLSVVVAAILASLDYSKGLHHNFTTALSLLLELHAKDRATWLDGVARMLKKSCHIIGL